MIKEILKLELKEKIRRIYPLVILVGICIYFYTYHFVQYQMYHAASMDVIMSTQRLSFLCFLAVAFLSFDFFSDLNHRNWNELLRMKSAGIRNVCISRIVILLGITGVFFLNIIFIDLILLWPCHTMPASVQENIWLALVLNFILFPAVGIFLGIFAKSCLRRWQGYLFLIICMLLFVGVFQIINTRLYMAYNGKMNLDILSRILTLTQPNQRWIVDELYLIPVEPYRFFLYFGWILLLSGFVCYVLLNQKKKFFSIFPWVVCAICFWNVVDAGCISNMDSNTGNAANDYNTFEEETLPECAADFSVGSYDIHLTIAKRLRAKVCMEINEQKNTYQFTLYRNYILDSVTDENGEKMEYERDRDYITVQASGPVSEINMKYHGYSGTFVSNSNAVLLPGFFAWYPQPGFRPVFKQTIADTYYSYGYNKDISGFSQSEFQVNISGYPKPVYSNLEEENGIFEGSAKSVTLMGGGVEESTQEGVRIVYPALTELLPDFVSRYEAALKEKCNYLGFDYGELKELDEIFFLPSLYDMTDSDRTGFSMEDYILTVGNYDPEGAANGAIYNIMPQEGLKSVLWSEVLRRAENNNSGHSISREEYLEWEPESNVPDWPVENMYATLVESFSEKEVNQRIIEYLKDTSEDRDCISFLKDLYLDLEGN